MKQITHTDLENLILTKLKGASFISLRTETSQTSLNKGSGVNAMVETIQVDPAKIVKHSDLVGLIAGGTISYEDFVNNRLLKEAKEKGKDKAQLTFEVGKRTWGEHYKESPALVHHKGAKYLVVYCVANTKPKVHHIYENESIDLKDTRFDRYRKPERKEGDNQGTKSPIVVRDYKFDSIKEITIFRETYSVVPDPE